MGQPSSTDNGDLNANMPAIAGELQPVPTAAVNGTLADRLVPIVDKIRATAAKIGLSPYRVWLLHIQWTGAEVGDGQMTIIARHEITPSPRVRDMNATSFGMRNTGLAEEGSLFVDRISARFTEDDLTGKTPDLQNPVMQSTSKMNVQFVWEVRESRPSTPPPEPRWYVPSAAPMLVRGGMEWRVALSKKDYNPGRYRELAPPTEL